MLGRNILQHCALRRGKAQVLTSQIERLCHHDSKVSNHDKVYELRCYEVNTKDVKKYIELTTDPGMTIRMKYSKMLGYWQSEYGGVCSQFIHLWEYDSLDDRLNRRKKLLADRAWLADYIANVSPMWNFQESNLLRLLPWAEIPRDVPDGGVYQLERLTLNGDIGGDMKKIEDYGLLVDVENERLLLGAWNVISGKLNTVCLLHRYGSQDGAIHHHIHDKCKTAQAYKSILPLTSSVESRILLPCSFSPWK